MYKYILLFFIIALKGQAQLFVENVPQITKATTLAQYLAGNNVTILNAMINCHNEGAAIFRTTSDTIVGLDSGIVLSSGNVKTTYTSPTPNINFIDKEGIDLPAIYTANNRYLNTVTNDTLLNSISTSTTQYDRCRLEFDIIPRGDSIRFYFVFASDEYPQYVCYDVNDVFGLFISGPGISGSKNIALVPNTNVAVSLNSIFDTTDILKNINNFKYSNCTMWGPGSPYTQYFKKNDSSQFLVYSGMTVPISAYSPVIPLDTYHLTFVIADIGDEWFDSGVFIKSRSLVSNSIIVATPYSTGGVLVDHPYMMEACDSVRLNFKTSKKLTNSMSLDLTYGGSAIFKVDYDSLPPSIVIPANDSTFDLYIKPLKDNLVEPSDSIIIYITNHVSYYDTIVYKIYDAFSGVSVYNLTNDTTVCNKSVFNLYVKKENEINYSIKWSPATFLSSDSIFNPIVTPNVSANTDSLLYNIKISHQGCSSLDSQIKVYILDFPEITMINNTQICGNDSIYLNPIINSTGTYSYSWTPNIDIEDTSILNPRFFTKNSTLYRLEISGAKVCKILDSVKINHFNSPQLLYTFRPQTCINNKGSIDMSASLGSPPYNYFCSNGVNSSKVINLSGPQTYKIFVVDLNSCSDSANVFIDSIPKLSTLYSSDSSYCSLANGNIYTTTKDGTLPYTYKWSNGNTSNNNLNINSGFYNVTITDSYNCSISILNIKISNIAPNFINQTTKTDLRCFQLPEGEVILKLSGGFPNYQYNFNNQGYLTNNQYSNLLSGKYYYDIRDSKGCIFSDSISLIQPDKIKIDSKTIKDVSCSDYQDGSIEIESSGGILPHKYLWSNASNSSKINKLKAGTYLLTITDANGCIATNSFTVNSSNSFSITEKIKHSTCFSKNLGEINLTIVGGSTPFRYEWSNQSEEKNQKNLSVGKYQLTITDKNNCVYNYEYEISSPPPIKITNISINQPTCLRLGDGQINLSASGGVGDFLYRIENRTDYQKIGNFSWLESGNYTFKVKDNNNCEIDTLITLNDPIKNEIEIIPSDTTVVIGESFPMTFNVTKGNNNIKSILWSPNDGLSCSDCKTPIVSTYVTTEYKLEVIDTFGCIAIANSKVYIQDSAIIFIPNSFSPNGDDINDEFRIYGNKIVNIRLAIYNRWGEKVYEKNNGNLEGWNGYYKNNLAPSGVYKYVAEITTLSKKIIFKSGDLTLIR